MNRHYEKLGRSLKPPGPKYHPDPLTGLGDIPDKVYSTELKLIVGGCFELGSMAHT